MYLETIKSRKNGKTYLTHLVRESYRDNGKVKHRTVCNVTHLPAVHLARLKNSLEGRSCSFDVENLQMGRSLEHGASFAFWSFAKQLGLDRMIYSAKTLWREDVMAMIVGRLVYQGSKLNLTNLYADTTLWEQAGLPAGERPDVEKHCYAPMDELLKRKERIERKLTQRHLNDGCVVLYDITNTWMEGEYVDSQYVAYGKPKGGKKGYKQIALGLLTDRHGCPVGVEIFKGSRSDQTTVLEQVKKLSNRYGIKHVVFTGDRGMLTPKRIDELSEQQYDTITALTHPQLEALLNRNDIQPDMFEEKQIIEICEYEEKEEAEVSAQGDEKEKTIIRYMLCKNDQTMHKERRTRNALIQSVKDKLTQKAAVKNLRKPLKVAASVGRLFERKKVGKFFSWDVDQRGGLTWSLDEEKVRKEEQFDGCYAIRTQVTADKMKKEEVVNSYRGLQLVEQAFKNMKTVMLEMRPMFHKTDDRLCAHIFIVALAYYIQWHAMQRLKPLFDADGTHEDKRWTFQIVVERLKSLRMTECIIDGIVVKRTVSKPDREQQHILDLLGVKMM
ncbi:MAG: IS1634 family transposase [Actinobacteria bacterium]|nr:IS1634 family transposase [Actinomycetota bacterium]